MILIPFYITLDTIVQMRVALCGIVSAFISLRQYSERWHEVRNFQLLVMELCKFKPITSHPRRHRESFN
uniref:Putative secreted protein n=1 Tax=Anopheles triannulatus TaxID=58253 RepID=A0A2M4B633_9DIPT